VLEMPEVMKSLLQQVRRYIQEMTDYDKIRVIYIDDSSGEISDLGIMKGNVL